MISLIKFFSYIFILVSWHYVSSIFFVFIWSLIIQISLNIGKENCLIYIKVCLMPLNKKLPPILILIMLIYMKWFMHLSKSIATNFCEKCCEKIGYLEYYRAMSQNGFQISAVYLSMHRLRAFYHTFRD